MDKIIEEAYKELPALEIKQLNNTHLNSDSLAFVYALYPFFLKKPFTRIKQVPKVTHTRYDLKS